MGSRRAVVADRFTVLDCREWPIVGAGRSTQDLVVVVARNRVVAVSEPARDQGVEVGLRVREAQRRAPGVEVLAPDSAGESRAFEPVLRALEDIAARVEIDRPGRCAFLTRGPSRYFGGDRLMSDRVAALVTKTLETATSVGVGTADSRFAAVVASGMAEPGRAQVVPPGESGEFLAPLPIATLIVGVGEGASAGFGTVVEDTVDVLDRLGLTTLGAFAGLRSREVMGRFGSVGARLHRWAQGEDDHLARLERVPPEFTVTVELDPPVERVDQAAFVARSLAEEFIDRLAGAGARCARIEIGVETEHGEEQVRLWRADEAFEVASIADRLRWQLDGWLSGPLPQRPTGGLSRLTLCPDDLSVAAGRQLDLWGVDTGRAERAARSVARVLGIAGPGTVRVPEVRGGRHPAEMVTAIPAESVDLVERSRAVDRALMGRANTEPGDPTAGVVGPPGPRAGADAGEWLGALPPPMPTRVLVVPEPIELVDGAGDPVVVNRRGQLLNSPDRAGPTRVVGWSGPWLIDERWWHRDRHRRQVRIQLALADGRAILVAATAGVWSLEAVYD